MAYNTTIIKKDAEGKPIPQYWNELANQYEVLEGENGASRVKIVNDTLETKAPDIETKLNDILVKLGQEVKTSLISSIPAGSNVIGNVKIEGNSNLIQGNLVCTGTSQQLPNQVCKNATIQAEPSNAGYVYIGKSGVNEENHMCTLSPGSSMTFYVANTNLLYVYGNDGDRICWGGEA